MSDHGGMEAIVERVVGQILDSHAAQVRDEIVRKVTQEIAAQPAMPSAAAGASGDLARAVSDIRVCTSQKEILRALLDLSSRYAARVVLFVVKGGHAAGWQARGFADSDALKDFPLDAGAPAVQRAISNRLSGAAPADDFDGRFLESFGAPSSDGFLFPLILKDKVAALVYADSGSDGGLFDPGALEVLVLSASSWLEVNALRKQAGAAGAPQQAHGVPVQTSGSAQTYNDPFSAHAPAFAMAAAASGGPDATFAAPVESAAFGGAHTEAIEVQSAAAPASVAVEPLPMEHAAPSSTEASSATASAASATSPADVEVLHKAQRFARLLVDEIKLYNQAKVAEGRKNKDLFDRLKDAIEKSRSTYQKRYGSTVAASANCFHHELIRSLAEDDVSVMGPNFQM